MPLRLTPGEIESAKRADLPNLVSRSINLSRVGRSYWGICPFHKESTPSFKVENQLFHCFGCGAHGDAIDWIMATGKMSFTEAVCEALETYNPENSKISSQRFLAGSSRSSDPNPPEQFAVALWRRRKPIVGTLAANYLNTRAIDSKWRPSLGFIESVAHTSGRSYAALIAAVQSASQQGPTAVQITFLDSLGQKADFPLPRLTYGRLGTGAVRFGAAGTVLGIAEGVETAMSAQQIFAVPVWASLGGGRMGRVAVPETVRELIVFADNDDAGRIAAERAERRFSDRHTVHVELPPCNFNDWNDVARGRLLP